MPHRQNTDCSVALRNPVSARIHASRFCSLTFVVLLATTATLFFGGNLGRWADDYYFLRQFERSAHADNLNSPMQVTSWTLNDRMHFWRPLYRYIYTPIVTTLYQWPVALHLMAACCHMAVCMVLWAFLRSLGASRTSAAIAALAFLVYPAHFEGVFWVPCTPTPFATGLMLAALWMQARWALHVRGSHKVAKRRPVLFALTPPALAFSACCLNEQPAFIVAAMPLVVWGGRFGKLEQPSASSNVQPHPRWLVALVPAILAGGAVLAYMLIASARIPPRVAPVTGGVVEPSDLWRRAMDFATDVLSRHALRGFGSGAWKEGWQALSERPTFAIAIFGLLAIAGTGWAWQYGSVETPTAGLDQRGGQHPGRTGPRLALLGFGIVLASWGPLVFIHYPASSRLAYVPSVGLAIAIAGLLDGLLGRAHFRPSLCISARAISLLLLLPCAVMMIGVQHAYRARWQADERQGAALRQLLPEPATVPRPVFVPVRVADRPVHTGTRAFDEHFVSPLITEWAAGWWLQLHYRRSDLMCVQGQVGGAPIVGWVDAQSVQSTLRLVPPSKPRVRRFELAQMIPFEVGEDGKVVLYTHVIFEGAATAATPTLLPLVKQAFEQGRLPLRVLAMPRVPEEDVRPIAAPTGR